MSQLTPDSTDHGEIPITRRVLLGSALVAGAAYVAGGVAVFGLGDAVAASASASADFLHLSEFITGGQPLEAGLATRYQAALVKRDAKFDESARALQAYVADAKAANVDELLARADLNDPLRKTIKSIVSAWYLGIVGVDADAELIAYSKALMYRPTRDVLVVPTYGGGPDSWGDKPAGTTTLDTRKTA